MAVPDLSAPLVRIQEMRSQRGESAKQREHERSQALKQFGMNIGKAAFETLADVGVEAFKEKLQRPYELADRGVSEVELPAPDMKKSVMASPLSQYFKGTGPVPEDPFAARSQSPMATQPSVTQSPAANPAAPTEPAKVDEPKVAEPFMGPPQATKPTAESIKARRIEAARRRVASVEDRAFAQGLLKDAEAGDAGALDALEEMPLASAPAEGVARSERRDGEAYRAMGTGGGAIASPGYTPPGYSSAGRTKVLGPLPGEGMIEGDVQVKDKRTGKIIYSDTQPPGPPSMAAPPQVPPAAGEPTPLGAGGMRGLFQSLAASRAAGNFRESRDDTMMRRLDQLDPKDRAFVQAAGLKRKEIEAGTALNRAQEVQALANAGRLEFENSKEFKEATLRKLSAEAARAETGGQLDVAKAKKLEMEKLASKLRYMGPEAEGYEDAKMAHNTKVLKAAQLVEQRTSGSSNFMSGAGGSSANIPATRVGVVADSQGWLDLITADGAGRFSKQEYRPDENGNLIPWATRYYTPPKDRRDRLWKESGVVPAPALVKALGEGPPAPAPGAAPPVPAGRGKPKVAVEPVAPATAPAAPAAPIAAKPSWQDKSTWDSASLADLTSMMKDAERKAKEDRDVAARTAFQDLKARIEVKKVEKGETQEAKATGRTTSEREASEASAWAKLVPSPVTTKERVDAWFSEYESGGDLAFARPNGKTADFERSEVTRIFNAPTEEKAKKAVPAQADAAAELWSGRNKYDRGLRPSPELSAIQGALTEYIQAAPGRALDGFKEAYLRKTGRTLSPAVQKQLQVPTYAPGPAQVAPPQVPPGQQSRLDQMFQAIDEKPWSAARKRRVFMEAVKRGGLA